MWLIKKTLDECYVCQWTNDIKECEGFRLLILSDHAYSTHPDLDEVYGMLDDAEMGMHEPYYIRWKNSPQEI